MRELSAGIKGQVANADATVFTYPDNFPMPDVNAGKESGSLLVPSVTRGDMEGATSVLVNEQQKK